MKPVTIPFIRQEGISITTLAIVTFSLENNDADPMTELRAAASSWIRDTEQGRAVWEYSGGDMNIVRQEYRAS